MSAHGVDPVDPDLEREKFRGDMEIRRLEIALKQREQDRLDQELSLKKKEESRSRWTNPLVIAVLGATVAALGNAGVTWLNGRAQINLENEKAIKTQTQENERAKASLALEESKSEAARILEMIKTNDADKAAENLKFLVESGLILNADRRRQIERYLATRKPGTGTTLPVSGSSPASKTTLSCRIKSSDDLSRLVVPNTYIVSITQSPTECEFSLSAGAGLPGSKKVQCTTVRAFAWVPNDVSASIFERQNQAGSGKECIIDVAG